MGALGAAVVVAFAGRAVEATGRASRAAMSEIDRQLRSFPVSGGQLQLPAGYTPSYRTLVDLASRSSIEGLLLDVAIGLALPFAIGLGLRAAYPASALALDGLYAFVVMASLTGVGAALVADGAGAALGAAHREARPRASSSSSEATVAGHQVGHLVGNVVAPAAHLFIATLAATALLLASFAGL
jgi:Na+/H+-translocating membrane pyrophosphatase